MDGAWEELLAMLNKNDLTGQWSGWGIEDDEGTWAAILGWKDFDVSLSVGFQASYAY